MTDPPAVTFLRERHPDEAQLACWVRDVILSAEPDLAERVYEGWDGIGFRHPAAGYVCGLFPRPGDVRLLFERGRELEDPDGLLEGEGTQTRTVPIDKPDPALAEGITRLLRDAIALGLAPR